MPGWPEGSIARQLLYHSSDEKDPMPPIPVERGKPIKPFLRKELFVVGSGIDAHRRMSAYSGPLAYEDACFARIATDENRHPRTLLLGPQIVDRTFNRAYPGVNLPDAIVFSAERDHWILQNLYEFRTGSLGAGRKLRGFAMLLDKMRKDQKRLATIVKGALSVADGIPDIFIVPPTEEITVVFISTTKRTGVIFEEDSPPFKEVAHEFIAAA